MGKYDWIKIGAYCKWNDVAIDDYDAEEKEIAQNTIYEIFDIRKNVDEEIDDDTIILITSDVSEVEVYPHELIEV